MAETLHSRYHNDMVASPAVWYVATAKPGSGYFHAVKGYAQKLAHACDSTALALESGATTELVQHLAAYDGPPRLLIGAEEEAVNAVRWGCPPSLLKARPYQDMHGRGPSMHDLTQQELQERRESSPFAVLPSPRLLVVMGNPHWLMSAPEMWIRSFTHQLDALRPASVMLSASPRTNPLLWEQLPALWADALHADCQLAVNPAIAGEANRYRDMLALADAVVIVGSSRSMAGEAALTGKPIWYLADNNTDAEGFFSDAHALMGSAAARYRPAKQPLHWQETYAPIDITNYYVIEVINQLRKAG